MKNVNWEKKFIYGNMSNLGYITLFINHQYYFSQVSYLKINKNVKKKIIIIYENIKLFIKSLEQSESPMIVHTIQG